MNLDFTFQQICKKSAELGVNCSADKESLIIELVDSKITISSIGTSLSICCNNEDVFNLIYAKYGSIHHDRKSLTFVISRDDAEEFVEVFAQCAFQKLLSDPVFEIQDITSVESTESEAKKKLRKGQAWLREQAMIYWGGRCAVTGAAVPEILEACHIKPWSDSSCTAKERLSVENIIILSIHLHRLFDAGLISFSNDGKLLISEKLSEENIAILFGSRDVYLSRQLVPGQIRYLEYHRANIFQPC